MIDDRHLRDLGSRGLLGGPWTGDPAEVGLRPGSVDYPDAFAGTLLGGACGDALGRPVEGWPARLIQDRFGVLDRFVPRPGLPGPAGIITDDTQLTMVLAESIVDRGELDPADVARRFVEWLPEGRGKGRATTEAVVRLESGVPWWKAGTRSAGNGAAMRASPIGLLHPLDPDGIRRDGAVSAVITHADPMAAASAVAQGFAIAYSLHHTAEAFDVDAFMSALGRVMDGVPDPGHPERRPDRTPARVRLIDRIRRAVDMRDHPPAEVFDRLHTGAFVLESLPSAFYCFARSPDDPERVIVTAANGGGDADTVAAMAGNLAGALHGARALPRRWLDDLEFRDDLERLSARILPLTPLGSEVPGTPADSTKERP